MWVENRSDDLWIGVKGLSSWQIARSLRNNFRVSLRDQPVEVERLDGLSGLTD